MDHSSHGSHFVETAASADPVSAVSWLDSLSQAGFMPHGHCYLWKPGLVATHAASDFMIGIAYVSISLILYALVRAVRLQFSFVVVCFGLFIGACGLTHFIEVWTLWHPDYYLSGGVKVITALASVGTGVYLFRLRRPILTVAEAAKLSEQRQLDLEALTKDLEERVRERTFEAENRAAEFRAFFELSGFGAAMVDAATLKFIRVNESFCQLLGYSADELRQMTFSQITHPEDRERDLARYEDAKCGRASHWQIEKRYVRKDGRVVLVRINGTMIRRSDGSPSHSVAIIEDITQRRQAEENLKASEAQFRTVTNAMPQMVWTSDAVGNVDYNNDKWYEWTGLNRDRSLGDAWFDLVHPEDQPRIAEAWKHSVETGEIYQIEIRFKRSKDQEFRWILVRALPLRDDSGRIMKWIGTNTDIHDQKLSEAELAQAKEEAERANQLKSAFLANMSHEIRTPLGALLGFADLMRDSSLSDSERASYIEVMTRNGEQLSVIINDILDLSKVEAGHLDFEYIPARPLTLVEDVASLLRVKAEEKNLVLDFIAEDGAPEKIVTDPLRLRQILLNIVANAVKFTRFGRVCVSVHPWTSSRGRAGVRFEVEDSGIGIAVGQQEKIFEMFVQADGSMTRRFGGTGLGLALSRKLARELGGDVFIKSSTVGQGTVFAIDIEDRPELRREMGAATARSAVAPSSGIPLETRSLEGVRVLVVDDSPDNQRLIWRYLTKRGARVETAENGLSGCRAALAGQFDIVLMDLQMPEMDGYTATQRLRDAGYQKPIIALTAHAMSDARLKCLNVGCTDHLTKPINPAELIEAVGRYAEGARA